MGFGQLPGRRDRESGARNPAEVPPLEGPWGVFGVQRHGVVYSQMIDSLIIGSAGTHVHPPVRALVEGSRKALWKNH